MHFLFSAKLYSICEKRHFEVSDDLKKSVLVAEVATMILILILLNTSGCNSGVEIYLLQDITELSCVSSNSKSELEIKCVIQCSKSHIPEVTRHSMQLASHRK